MNSASGNLSTDCTPYPIMFTSANSIANISNQTPINPTLDNNSFNGSILNMGITGNQNTQQLFAIGYQFDNSGSGSYNAVLCRLLIGTNDATCDVILPSYVANNVTSMPTNLFIAPDASIIYAIQNSNVFTIAPNNTSAGPNLISALTPYNIESINYVSIKSSNAKYSIYAYQYPYYCKYH